MLITKENQMQIKMYNRIMNQCDSEFTKRYFLELQGLKNGGMTKENFLKRIKYSKRHYLTCLKHDRYTYISRGWAGTCSIWDF